MNFVHYQITFLINSNAPLLHWQSALKAENLSVNVNIDPQLTTKLVLAFCFILIDKLIKKNAKAFQFPYNIQYLLIC